MVAAWQGQVRGGTQSPASRAPRTNSRGTGSA
jgi:hypothetical protein